jgi:uncharacterized RDD family membrane protein YckC
MNATAQASAAPVSGSKLDNRRVLAALIDLVVVAAGGAVILAAAGRLGDPPSEFGGALGLVVLGWALYYYFACESGNGQTLGKRAMKIRVVRTDGRPAGMREISLRTVLRVIDMQLVYLVGLIVMISTGERRGRLGDLAGATMIVTADQPAAIATAQEPAAPVSRVPIAESGPAFAPVPEDEPDAEPDEPEVASPALQELAADVSAVTSAPDREVEEPAEEPAPEEPAAADESAAAEEPAAEEPAAEEPADDEPAAEEAAPEDEPVVEVTEDEPEDSEDAEVRVKSVETISAIDLVMDQSRRDS